MGTQLCGAPATRPASSGIGAGAPSGADGAQLARNAAAATVPSLKTVRMVLALSSSTTHDSANKSRESYRGGGENGMTLTKVMRVLCAAALASGSISASAAQSPPAAAVAH